MIPEIRLAQARDIHYLADIDLKSYDYPWSLTQWREIGTDPTTAVMIAAVRADPVGMYVWRKQPNIKQAEILKLATKPIFRGRGIGTFLLLAAEAAMCASSLNEATIIVPEINCLPDHPDDVSSWLVKRGYHVVLPILEGRFRMYGKRCDGFKFVHDVRDSE